MRDSPKPNLEYKTKTMNQFQAKTVDDCTWYATNDGFEYISKGDDYAKSPEAMRKKHTGSISGPSKLANVLTAYNKEYPKTVSYTQSPGTPFKFFDCVRALEFGAYLIVLGDYEKLPVYYRRWTNNDKFDHAVGATLFNKDVKLFKGSVGATWFYDPLGGGINNKAYAGEWIAVEWLFNDFAWKTNGAISAGILDQYTEVSMFTVAKKQTTPRIVTLKAGTELMKTPAANGAIAKTLKNQQDLPYLGTENADWHIVLSNVPNLEALKGVYVHKSRVMTIKNVPETPTDEALAKALAETQKKLDEVTQANEILNSRVATANTRLTKIDKEAVTV